jgi:hypothetical protein
MFPEFHKARLLIHIAFHYTPGRETYLDQVLAAIATYDFQYIQVNIDTNTESARSAIKPCADRLELRWCVHDQLADPFQLTWQHRLAMSKHIADFDYFMYLEDDMQVLFTTLKRWRDDSLRLYPEGYLRAFLRTETNADGRIVSTDQKRVTGTHNYKRAAGEVWYYPDNPYHAIWICSRQQFQDFVDGPAWIDGNNSELGVRERAAAGMTWHRGGPHRSLLPLDPQGMTHPDAQIQHLPNNYALDPAEEYGSLTLEKLHNSRRMVVIYRNCLGLLKTLSQSTRKSVE